MKSYIFHILLIVRFVNLSYSQTSNISSLTNSINFKTVKIGDLTWSAENLNTSYFNNGDQIPEAKSSEEWKKYSGSKSPAWCYYDFDPTNGAKYGKLYNWWAINDSRGIIPIGWRIPTSSDWGKLTKELTNPSSLKTTAFSKMKSTKGWSSWTTGGKKTKYVDCQNCINWNDSYRKKVPCHICRDERQLPVTVNEPIVTHSGNGSNESGFNALPGGAIDENGFFHFKGEAGAWWEYSEEQTVYIKSDYFVLMSNFWNELGFSWNFNDTKDFYEGRGFSVRCVGEDKPQTIINSVATSNNENISANTVVEELESFNDAANYDKITIGPQVWMSKNLNANKFRDGEPIPHAKNAEEWQKAVNEKKPAWCYYDFDSKNGEKYGKLYNWYAVNDPRGLAPLGWHVATKIEWTSLINYLGGRNSACIKMNSTSGWDSYEGKTGNGTNESGFSALPGGYRSHYGNFNRINKSGEWWSSTSWSINDNNAYYFGSFYTGYVEERVYLKEAGLSVRCVKD
jgi:uncharacterized protein (TIGR02145 family)